MRNILVTGGAGFIGSNFVAYLRSRRPDLRVTVLDKLTYAGNLENLKAAMKDEGLNFVKGDITDAGLVDAVFSKEAIDTVAHLAAESHVDRSITGPKAFIETNVLGTFTLLETARRHWLDKDGALKPPGARFLHVSTDEVYGSLGTEGYFTEKTAYSPNSPYSATKAGSDHLARAYFHTYGLPVVTTNCSNNYGQYQFPEKLIPLVIINALKGAPIPVYGDGRNVRDWLYVEDHCEALYSALEKGRLGEKYNVGGRCERANIDIVRRICSMIDEAVSDKGLAALYPLDKPRESLIAFVKDRPGHDRRYAIDCSKIEAQLGWRPRHSFEDGLQRTVDWYIANRQWWERILSGEYMAGLQETP